MRILRPLFAICLSFAMVLTSNAMASARSANAPAMQMELCTGLTLTTIYLDRDGTPTQAPHFCPDCTLVMVDPAGAAFVLARNVIDFFPPQAFAIVAPARFAHHAYLSRAPPILSIR